DRYLVLQCWCGGIAVGHLLLESLYAGKPLDRWVNYLALGLLGLALLSGLWMEPKLKRLHIELYGVRSTPQQRLEAGQSTRAWKGVLTISSWVALAGLWIYLWEVTGTSAGVRFAGSGKVRG